VPTKTLRGTNEQWKDSCCRWYQAMTSCQLSYNAIVRSDMEMPAFYAGCLRYMAIPPGGNPGTRSDLGLGRASSYSSSPEENQREMSWQDG
jgi:hypothetical protein